MIAQLRKEEKLTWHDSKNDYYKYDKIKCIINRQAYNNINF